MFRALSARSECCPFFYVRVFNMNLGCLLLIREHAVVSISSSFQFTLDDYFLITACIEMMTGFYSIKMIHSGPSLHMFIEPRAHLLGRAVLYVQ